MVFRFSDRRESYMLYVVVWVPYVNLRGITKNEGGFFFASGKPEEGDKFPDYFQKSALEIILSYSPLVLPSMLPQIMLATPLFTLWMLKSLSAFSMRKAKSTLACLLRYVNDYYMHSRIVLSYLFQDERSQIMTTSVWVKHVSYIAKW